MNTIAFDTHHVIKTLTQSGVPEKQAEAIGLVLIEAVSEQQHLVTKTDLKAELGASSAEYKTTLADAKVEIIKWVAAMLVAQAAVVATLVKLL